MYGLIMLRGVAGFGKGRVSVGCLNWDFLGLGEGRIGMFLAEVAWREGRAGSLTAGQDYRIWPQVLAAQAQ